MPEQVTIKEVYELLDKTKAEISAHILRLESKFDTMEAGRLTRLEREYAEFVAAFEPIKKLTYSLVGVVLLTVLAAILKLVVFQ